MGRNKPDLSVKFAGVEFSSPIGVGPVGRPFGKNCTPELHAEVLLKHVDAGASHICIPTCNYVTNETIEKLKEATAPEKTPTFKARQMMTLKLETPQAPYGVEGLYLLITPFWKDLNELKSAYVHVEELTKILMDKKPSHVRLLANVTGLGGLPESYVDAAKRWEELGADLIELNLSCPVPMTISKATDYFFEDKYPMRWQGAVEGSNSDRVAEITRAVVQAVNIPVGVKLTTESGFMQVVELARRTRDAGAKWIQAINLAVAIAPPDIYNRGKSPWPYADSNPFVGASGSFLRVQCYKDVAAIAKFAPGIDIAAAGGLVLPEHIVEVLMLGARLTQLCTGVIEKGRKLIRQSDKFLGKFLVEQGYDSVEDIVGLGQQYIKGNEEVDFSKRSLVAVTDESKCENCGACVDNICIARYAENGSVKVREENCVGCGMCMLACQSGAIRIVARD